MKPIDRRKLLLACTLLLLAIAAAFGLIFTSWDGGEGDGVNPVAQEKKAIENACASAPTFQGLKQLVFDQAGRLRTIERVNFDILAAGAVVRMEEPVVRSHDERLGLTRCSGRFILELPPGAETAFNGERRLAVDAVYEIQDAADGSGAVYRMAGAETIVSRLAAFDMQGQRLEAPAVAVAEPAADPGEFAEPLLPPDAVSPPMAPPEPQATANPSFDCRNARTRGEIMVCESDRLAAQDRSMAALYGAAMEDATPGTRRQLVRTRDAFLAYRDRCPDSACVAQAYEGRMREIRDIMAEAE